LPIIGAAYGISAKSISEKAETAMRITDYVQALRLKHSIKNLLIVLAPLASGQALSFGSSARIVFAFCIFTFAASAVYVLNDCFDIKTDINDQEKKDGPITSGRIQKRNAIFYSLALAVLSLSLAGFLSFSILLLILIYLLVNLLYTLGLKNQPVIELFCVASGFVIRAVVGGQSAEIKISDSFISIVAWASLFLVISKRITEKRIVVERSAGGDVGLGTRQVLSRYSDQFLVFALTVSGSLFLFSFSTWAFTFSDYLHRYSVVLISILLFRFVSDLDESRTKSMIDKFFGDPFLILMSILLSVMLIVPTWF
jgi:decaprenyl-phosphate phosphoribosyltransferase